MNSRGGYGAYGNYGSYGNFGNYGNFGTQGESKSHVDYSTTQILADKKKQALRYSYETLGNLLSTAENFAGLADEKYKNFNVTTSYDYENLKSEFAWELYCFQLAIKKYQKKFQCPYKFPDDLPKEKIIKDIYRYMGKIQNEKDKILYNSMINIIKGEKLNIDFDKLFAELDKNANSKMKPDKLKKIIGPLNEILEQNMEEADKGNMNLELENDKHKKNRDNLKKASLDTKTIRVNIGTEGKLKNIKNSFFFTPYKNNTQISINLDEPRFDVFNTLYPSLYTFNGNKGKIYIVPINNNNNKDSYKAIVFNEIEKEFNEEFFKKIESFDLKDNKYIVGIIKFENNKIPVLIKENNDEDMK